MDQEALVERGYTLVELLEARGVNPLAALWVVDTDTETWKLWIVPPPELKKELDFYRQMSVVISENRENLQGLDVSDIEMIRDDHPAIKGLRALVKLSRTGRRSPGFVQNNMVNGFYLPDAILLFLLR